MGKHREMTEVLLRDGKARVLEGNKNVNSYCAKYEKCQHREMASGSNNANGSSHEKKSTDVLNKPQWK